MALDWQAPKHSMHGDMVELIAPFGPYTIEFGMVPTSEYQPPQYCVACCDHDSDAPLIWEKVFFSGDEAKAYAEQRARSDGTLMKPVPTLDRLRQAVLEINDKRCPKWRFRLAEDVVLQLQPRPAESRYSFNLFEGIVIQGGGITREHFASRSAGQISGLMVVTLGIRDAGRGGYFDFLNGHPVPRPVYPGMWRLEWHGYSLRNREAAESLQDSVLNALPLIESLHARLMFYPACLLCGKGLSDPVSLARWIGPECAHNHTLDVGLFGVGALAEA